MLSDIQDGNEGGRRKGSDEADTVGATTLRKEHIKVSDDTVEFDFLGKDSVRWQETISVSGAHDMQFRNNMSKIIEGKEPKDEVFDMIRSTHVNAYYSGIVKGLSAKVFRTYSATKVVRTYLSEHADIKDATANQKIYRAKRANLEAAVMCNHKRTIPKNFAESLKKKKVKLKDAKSKVPWEKSEASLKKAKSAKPKTAKQKKSNRERIKKLKEQIKLQKTRHDERIERMKLQIELAEKTKDYNLGTSLRNYIDPRVVKAWTDHTGTEWEKLYTAALQRKFLWVHNEDLKWSDFAKNGNDTIADSK